MKDIKEAQNITFPACKEIARAYRIVFKQAARETTIFNRLEADAIVHMQ